MKTRMERKRLKSNRGSSTAVVLISAMTVVFVVLPIFSAVIEKYIIFNKAQIIKDAVDMTNIASYNAINTHDLSRNIVTFDGEELDKIYRYLLAKNLRLDSDLFPAEGSIAGDRVRIESVAAYTSGLPLTCPDGTEIKRPSVHSCVIVPVKPLLYRHIILNALNKEYIELKVHVDSEIPVNN